METRGRFDGAGWFRSRTGLVFLAFVAIAASDITLIKGSLRGVVMAIQISRATMRSVHRNLFSAFIYNTLGLRIALGALHPFLGILLSPLLAAIAMSFSSVTVIANANRLNWWKPRVG